MIICPISYHGLLMVRLLLFLFLLTSDLSLNCYSCLLCPEPFDPSSRLVHNDSNCQWCAVSEISLSLSCYECNPCPVPFSNSSVRIGHNCRWCAVSAMNHSFFEFQ
ncbi:unnamed protein product [Schistosoma mattheei]|uniref:Uncharacterized protein n=1 Tax=Schistosoma mattheei TaxID=31246 RepID=A0A183P3S0_9TREM|nr:unnamed protein product [Schistosoma mattheei]